MIYLVFVFLKEKEMLYGCYANAELARAEQSRLEDSLVYEYVTVRETAVIGGSCE